MGEPEYSQPADNFRNISLVMENGRLNFPTCKNLESGRILLYCMGQGAVGAEFEHTGALLPSPSPYMQQPLHNSRGRPVDQ